MNERLSQFKATISTPSSVFTFKLIYGQTVFGQLVVETNKTPVIWREKLFLDLFINYLCLLIVFMKLSFTSISHFHSKSNWICIKKEFLILKVSKTEISFSFIFFLFSHFLLWTRSTTVAFIAGEKHFHFNANKCERLSSAFRKKNSEIVGEWTLFMSS